MKSCYDLEKKGNNIVDTEMNVILILDSKTKLALIIMNFFIKRKID